MTQEKVLVVGCGMRPKPYAVNLDCVDILLLQSSPAFRDISVAGPATIPSDLFDGKTWYVQFDLDRINPRIWNDPEARIPLPFPSESFDRVEAEDVLEHVERPIDVMQELGRVLKVGGRLWIRGPDYRFGEIVWADLTHKRAFAPRTFDGFDPTTYDGKNYGFFHGPIKFKIIERAVEKNMGLEWILEKIGERK